MQRQVYKNVGWMETTAGMCFIFFITDTQQQLLHEYIRKKKQSYGFAAILPFVRLKKMFPFLSSRWLWFMCGGVNAGVYWCALCFQWSTPCSSAFHPSSCYNCSVWPSMTIEPLSYFSKAQKTFRMWCMRRGGNKNENHKACFAVFVILAARIWVAVQHISERCFSLYSLLEAMVEKAEQISQC